MEDKDQYDWNYERMEKAIAYVLEHHKEQPSLDEIAANCHMSAYHFQRMFTEWVGISPKKFIQYLTLKHAKQLLGSAQTSIFSTAQDMGLSSSSRLYDLFVTLEAMTPADYKQGGRGLSIVFDIRTTRLGNVLAACSPRGICYVSFYDNVAEAITLLTKEFPNAIIQQQTTLVLAQVFDLIEGIQPPEKLNLHVKGTSFQLKVWEALLKIPAGKLASYGQLASYIGSPNASRAVGTAIGSNPIAYLIPCHRVIQQSGALGGYMWGVPRKAILLGFEGVLKS